MKDLYHNLLAGMSINPASLGAGAKTGDAIIDIKGFESVLIVCMSGALTVDMPFQLMEGDESDLSDAAAVADADLLGSEPTLLAATDNEIATFGYRGTKRYLRVDTTTGTGLACAAILRGNDRHGPAV